MKEIKYKVREFESIMDALDFVDKTRGKLNVIVTNQVYHERFKFLISADITWKVTYKPKRKEEKHETSNR